MLNAIYSRFNDLQQIQLKWETDTIYDSYNKMFPRMHFFASNMAKDTTDANIWKLNDIQTLFCAAGGRVHTKEMTNSTRSIDRNGDF